MVSGGVVSTVKVRVSGVGSPTARTENMCSPSAKGPGVYGDAHAAKSLSSTLHSNVDGRVAENPNGGPPGASVVSSGVVS